MAVRTLSKGRIRFAEGGVNEKKSVLSSDSKSRDKAERIAFRRKTEATSIEHYLTRNERKFWNRMRPAQKEKLLRRAERRVGASGNEKTGKETAATKQAFKRVKQQMDVKGGAVDMTAVASSKMTINSRRKGAAPRTASSHSKSSFADQSFEPIQDTTDISEESEKAGSGYTNGRQPFNGKDFGFGSSTKGATAVGKKTSETTTDAASSIGVAASGGTTEAVKTGIKVAKKAAESVKQAAASMEQTREDQIRIEAASNSAHASGVIAKVQNAAMMIGAALMAGFMTLVQPILILLLPVIIIASILGAIISPISSLSDEELFPDQLNVEVDDEQVQAVLDMANQLLGTPYLMGGNDPATGIDCSGFTTLCFRAAGVNLPRTAQGQYDVSQHFSDESEALPGDLVFFTKTYNAGRTVTHVEIYLGDGKMVGAGNPVRVTSLHSPYFQQHFYSFGRVLDRRVPEEDEEGESYI